MRALFYYISIIGLLITAIGCFFWQPIAYALIVLVPYITIGILDINSKKHTVRRNYPVIGRLRYMLESIRPEIQQYFVESEQNGKPYSREIRSLIYQRAKGVLETLPFGTKNDLTQSGYEFSHHSMSPVVVDKSTARVTIGGLTCSKPYNASRLNVSAMSFGALSPNALLALNKGAKHGGFAHNTGEGGISPYHLEGGGDIIWQIGTGYFGCRDKEGNFNRDIFREKSSLEAVKMIEIKLSQGAKPSHGGILPGAKVNQEIAEIRGLEIGKDAISPPMHSAFTTPIELLEFVAELRELSGGKPVGFKLCIGIRKEFMAICKAMLKTGITPDFITIDGAEGGTGAAPIEFVNRLGTPINEAISFVNNCLIGINVRNKVTLIASGKIATGYDMIIKVALGADICNSARAMMFSLGCIQSLSCNTNLCPTGIATQDKRRWKSLDVEDKYRRVANYQKNTVHSFLDVLGAMGVKTPEELHPGLIKCYIAVGENKSYADIYPHLLPGELLTKGIHPAYEDDWNLAEL